MKGKQNAYSLQQNKKFVLDKGYSLDFEYILVSVNKITDTKIKGSNTLVDNILLADKKRTRQEWMNGIEELIHRIRKMDKNDLNEWITWFSNVIRELNEEERSKLIEQLREGDESAMCSSFERLLYKEKAEGLAEGEKSGKAADRAEAVIELLEDIGMPSEMLKNYIMEQKDLGILKVWFKAAARADSIEEFERAAGIELV